jgi:hypothetical protein
MYNVLERALLLNIVKSLSLFRDLASLETFPPYLVGNIKLTSSSA